MMHRQKKLNARPFDCRGVAAVEYALMAGLIALTLVVGLATLGGRIGSQYNSVDSSVGSGTKFDN